MKDMTETIQCGETLLQECECAERVCYIRKIRRNIRRYGLLALPVVALPPFFLGQVWWSMGIIFLWVLASYYLMQWLHVTITGDKLRRNPAWGASVVKIRGSSIQYSNASGSGISVSYYIPFYNSLLRSASRYFLQNRHYSQEIIMPADIASKMKERICKIIDSQSPRKLSLPKSEYVYKGAQIPIMAKRWLLSYVTPWSACVYVLLILSSCACFFGLKILELDNIASYIVYPSAFLAEYALIIKAPQNIEKVTLVYTFRRRAIVIRSSAGWVAVVPYTQADTLYLGEECNIMETAGGRFFPFPKAIPKEKLKVLNVKKLRPVNLPSTFLLVFTFLIINVAFMLLSLPFIL